MDRQADKHTSALRKEKMLLLRYACERVSRHVWKKGWRWRARQMERFALFACICDEGELEAIVGKMDDVKPIGTEGE